MNVMWPYGLVLLREQYHMNPALRSVKVAYINGLVFEYESARAQAATLATFIRDTYHVTQHRRPVSRTGVRLVQRWVVRPFESCDASECITARAVLSPEKEDS